MPETSNPVAGRAGYGGVARNVAANLALEDVTVDLVSRVGADAAGRHLLADLDRIGIGRTTAVTLPGAATAEYVAVLTPDGEFSLVLASLAVLDELTPDALVCHADPFAAAGRVFADCNLPFASLLALAHRSLPGARYRLAVARGCRTAAATAGRDGAVAIGDAAPMLPTKR